MFWSETIISVNEVAEAEIIQIGGKIDYWLNSSQLILGRKKKTITMTVVDTRAVSTYGSYMHIFW